MPHRLLINPETFKKCHQAIVDIHGKSTSETKVIKNTESETEAIKNAKTATPAAAPAKDSAAAKK